MQNYLWFLNGVMPAGRRHAGSKLIAGIRNDLKMHSETNVDSWALRVIPQCVCSVSANRSRQRRTGVAGRRIRRKVVTHLAILKSSNYRTDRLLGNEDIVIQRSCCGLYSQASTYPSNLLPSRRVSMLLLSWHCVTTFSVVMEVLPMQY
jgi:hypothetical protein